MGWPFGNGGRRRRCWKRVDRGEQPKEVWLALSFPYYHDSRDYDYTKEAVLRLLWHWPDGWTEYTNILGLYFDRWKAIDKAIARARIEAGIQRVRDRLNDHGIEAKLDPSMGDWVPEKGASHV